MLTIDITIVIQITVETTIWHGYFLGKLTKVTQTMLIRKTA